MYTTHVAVVRYLLQTRRNQPTKTQDPIYGKVLQDIDANCNLFLDWTIIQNT